MKEQFAGITLEDMFSQDCQHIQSTFSAIEASLLLRVALFMQERDALVQERDLLKEKLSVECQKSAVLHKKLLVAENRNIVPLD